MTYLKDRVHPVARIREARAVPVSERPEARRCAVCGAACVLAVAASLILPPTALAGWPLDSSASTALGFGATYKGPDGTSSTHRGVDLAVDSGASVCAPLSGRVSFAGRIPGIGGGTVLAVTIVTADGSFTLLPLSSTQVKAGNELAEGDVVGVLAGVGDASVEESHLHVGARRGDLYVDPLSLIAPPVTPPIDDAPMPSAPALTGQGEPAGVSGIATVPQVQSAVRAGASAASGVTVLRPAGLPSGATAAAGSPLGAGAPSVTAIPGASVAPGVSVVGALEVPTTAGSPMDAVSQAFSAASGGGNRNRSGEGVPGGAVVEWALGLAARGLEAGARVLAGVLLALGALWPIWRDERRKGAVQLSVRASADDIAAVTGR